MTYHVPSGFSVEGAPQPTTALWPDHAVFKIASHAIPDGENVQRSLVYNFTLLGSTDYPSLHDFYQKVATADQQQLVLTRATVAKGNCHEVRLTSRARPHAHYGCRYPHLRV